MCCSWLPLHPVEEWWECMVSDSLFEGDSHSFFVREIKNKRIPMQRVGRILRSMDSVYIHKCLQCQQKS